MTKVIDDVKKMAVAVKADSPKQHFERMEWLSKSLFGLEISGKKSIDSQTPGVRLDYNNFLRDKKYLRLPLKPLTWRNDDGLPKIAIFSLTSAVCSFRKCTFYSSSGGSVDREKLMILPILPSALFNLYEDVRVVLGKKCLEVCRSMRLESLEFYNYTVSCQFNGIIPDNERTKIMEAQTQKYFENIYVIADAKWGLETPVILPLGASQLAIGYADGKLWLITDFVTMPVNEAMIVN